MSNVKLSPPQFLVVVFMVFIFLGTLLLKIPFASNEPISWLDALFTSTSAMTVTGLITVDTGSAYTVFGECVIMLLIQVGGLGIMSFAILIFMMIGKKIGMKQRMYVQQALNQTTIGGVILLVKRLFIYSIISESIAVIFLTIRWAPEMGFGQGLYASVFHAISAFNNAGFSIWSDSLMGYVGDPVINIIITFLFITGGIGFTVLSDLWAEKEFRNLSLHTKLMLIGSLVINVIAFLFIFIFEYNNPATLGPLSSGEKILASYFQAVTPRTAGFNTLDIGSMEDSSIILILLLMFVGGGSASTAGGIKLTTFLIICFAVFTFLKGKYEIVILRRTIDPHLLLKALAIATIGLAFVFTALLVLSVTERHTSMLPLIFEVFSAFGTVGLSMGVTGELTAIGKVIIILIMFIGKLGPLTLAFSLAKQSSEKIRYPRGDVLAG
ncbi:TrkH family potassium uptake protein [Pseudalkalibacillus salsuginis]|uniref:TrkH family potassium uptake protein n=1 Tax=Pseudalkalibacillus salsuginis TaxID=2910972 RepID=UPI001F2A9819|nr:TrkH family potassium uptake protein [Pseudalkalibacillus salsuginis]MCF6409373.1 TrkH family potassium uptake protein [Pseudalkalibacillus salsuginis]